MISKSMFWALSLSISLSCLSTYAADDELQVDQIRFNFPAAAEEKQLMNDLWCNDERRCYGEQAFDRFVVSAVKPYRFPDRQLFQRMLVNKAEKKKRILAFHRAVYFAKQIPIAMGGSLFNFLTKCSRPDAFAQSFARIDFNESTGSKSIQISFFPSFRSTTDNSNTDIEFNFVRIGDEIVAKRDLFTPDILTQKAFLKNYNLKCWTPE